MWIFCLLIDLFILFILLMLVGEGLRTMREKERERKGLLILNRLMDIGFYPNLHWHPGSYQFIIGNVPRWQLKKSTHIF